MDRRRFVAAAAVFGATTGLAACVSNTPQRIAKNDEPTTTLMPLEERKFWLSSFACNIEQWFRPMPFLERINAAKALGFSAVEIWNPNNPKIGKTPGAIAARAKQQGVRVTSYSPNPPNFADLTKTQEFWEWLDIAIASGKALNVSNFNVTGHKIIEGLSNEQMIENYTKMLKLAAPRLEDENMVATIEPYNPFSHKGHFIYGNEPALSICREVNSPSVKINWDFFHMQRTNGNLITNLENGFDQVAYIQLADSPNRNQPGTGEVAYEKVLIRLRELGYTGFIGAEFFPENKDAQRAASDIAKLAKRINLSPPLVKSL
ncbi:TIM barrel protein [Glaciecola sp. SC05]|uniref:TIM barrel protein n=1 Tax=Glaciecola sp. SC05 TaxID=1987355 RepID=UPI0035295537